MAITLIYKHIVNKVTGQVLHQVQAHGPLHKPIIWVGYEAGNSVRIERSEFKNWVEAHQVGDVWFDRAGHKQVITALKPRTKNTVTATLMNTWHSGHPRQGEVTYQEEVLEGRAI